ncbi:MAG: hypothetical protein GY863_09440 [bacterium]|nr:hypothetical protein [bacterium]
MWTKIKTELAYYKMLIILLYLCDMTALYYHYLWTIGIGFINTAALVSIFTSTSLIFMISFYVSWINTKRERFYISKPGTVRETAIVRLIIPAGFWLIPAVIITAVELILNNDPENKIIMYLISITGMLLLVNSNFYIVKDMPFTFRPKKTFFGFYNDQASPFLYFIFIYFILLFTIVTVIGTNSSNMLGAFIDLIFSGFSPFVLIVSGAIFTYIGFRIYQKRIEFQD